MGDMERNELGGGHSFTWMVGDPAAHPTDDERFLQWRGALDTLVGIIEWHHKPDGTECGGAVMFVKGTGEPERPIWQVESLDPLTIHPSVHCTPDKGGCGSHGWIKQGRWTNA